MKTTFTLCLLVAFCLWPLLPSCEKKEEFLEVNVVDTSAITFVPSDSIGWDVGATFTEHWADVTIWADTIRVGNEDCVVIGKHRCEQGEDEE